MHCIVVVSVLHRIDTVSLHKHGRKGSIDQHPLTEVYMRVWGGLVPPVCSAESEEEALETAYLHCAGLFS